MTTPLDLMSADYLPPGSMGTMGTAVLDIGLLFFGLGALIVWMLLQARELAVRQAREDAELHDRASRPLSRGPSRAVRGRVDPNDASDVPLEVDIEERVTNHTSKNSEWHTWTEVSRSVRATPFYLVAEDREPVYVEVDREALLVDLLGTKYPNDTPGRRVRAAEIKRGDEVIIHGDLDEGPHPRASSTYRGGSGWILRAPRKGRMLVAAEGLARRYSARISMLAWSGTLLGLAFLVAHAFTTVPFLTATFVGRHVLASAKPYTYLRHDKHGTTRHYGIEAVADDGFTLRTDVSERTYDLVTQAAATPGEALSVPMLRTSNLAWASYVGNEPSTEGVLIVMELLAAGVTLLILKSRYRGAFPWYDQERVSEYGAPGHWQETRPEAPIDPSVS